MGCIDLFSVEAGWGFRAETLEECASRCGRWLNHLWDIHPDFRTLCWTGTGQQVPTRNLRDLCRSGALPRLFRSCRVHNTSRTRIRPDGWELTATHGNGSSQWLNLHLHVGSGSEDVDRGWLPNRVELAIIAGSNPGALAEMLLGLKPILFSMVDTWEVDLGWISSSSRTAQTAGRDSELLHWRLRGSWAFYLAERFARRVTPPARTVVERRAGGGLFMAACKDVFDASDAGHVKAASAIDACLLLLKPWPDG
jgi:hypothetical protein